MSVSVVGGRAVAIGGSSGWERGGRGIEDVDTPLETDADLAVPLPLGPTLVGRGFEGRFVMVTSDAKDADDSDVVRPATPLERGAREWYARGTAVCVDVVETEEEEDEAEGAGETARGDGGLGWEGVGVRDGDGGRRASIVSVYRVCNEETRC